MNLQKKIVYVVGGLYSPNGMSMVLSQKINYLAEHTDYDLYVILTENPEKPSFYHLPEKVHVTNFNINFDELDTMPLWKKMHHYNKKQTKYKQMFTDYLMEVKPDITVSAMRREINFLHSIPDGSLKIGELHFNRNSYSLCNNFCSVFVCICNLVRISTFWIRITIRFNTIKCYFLLISLL